MLANTIERWGSLAKSFHWIIALLIVLEVPLGYLMSYTYGLNYRDKGLALPLHSLFAQCHHTIGFLILLLATARLAWRLYGRGPEPLTAPSKYAPHVAALTHGLLYFLLFLLPLSGWSALSVYGLAPIWLFNFKGLVPSILPMLPINSFFGYGFFIRIHVYALYVGAVLVSLHIGAALIHHWFFKDGVLERMWPLARPQKRETI